MAAGSRPRFRSPALKRSGSSRTCFRSSIVSDPSRRRGDVNLAWPSAEIAVMGAKGAVEIIFRKDIGDPRKIAERTEEYRKKFANPFIAGSRGYIDDVIMPHETRRRICRSLAMLREKRLENPWRKHGNIPL